MFMINFLRLIDLRKINLSIFPAAGIGTDKVERQLNDVF